MGRATDEGRREEKQMKGEGRRRRWRERGREADGERGEERQMKESEDLRKRHK